MFKQKPLTIFTIITSIILFYGWNFMFWENTWMRSLGGNVLLIFCGVFSLFWLSKAYKNFPCKQRKFWSILGMGVLLQLVSNVVWFYFQITKGTITYPDASYFICLLSYIFFSFALIYKIKEINNNFLNSSYLFSVIIFMITATSISIHCLVRPIIVLSNNSLSIIISTIAYPILDLIILFCITILYYLTKNSKEKNPMLLIIIGFLLQIIADSIYAYLSITGGYQPENIINLLWSISILLIGSAGYYSREYKRETVHNIKNVFQRKESIFPYISIVLLIIFVNYSYNWNINFLSLGLTIVFLMVIGRQIIVINKNNKLMMEYRYLAYHDPLTGLNNRASFKKHLECMMKEYKDSNIALLLIDLDRFKVVNDTLGHQAGDYILIKTSERLIQTLETNNLIFRLGGDEFVIIIPQTNENECAIMAKKILEKFQKPFLIDNHEIIITPSIGISIFPKNSCNGEDLFKHADAAMYLAKENGKNSFRFYDSELDKIMVRKMKIENELRNAIERKQFSLAYQPKVNLHTKKIIGMEALLRWKHPELGFVSPAEFIPIAEDTGQIILIGEWVLKTACKQNKLWQEKGFASLYMSVNVSAIQLQQSEFLITVGKALQESGLDAGLLELEITESIMQNADESRELLYNLREMGVRISIDDFGTGYSSLNILQELPVNTLKIDKSFIHNIEDKKQKSMVKVIIELGINLNLNIVAEGIESEYQRQVLLRNKCSVGQGYLFSKPLEAKEIESKFLRNNSVGIKNTLSS